MINQTRARRYAIALFPVFFLFSHLHHLRVAAFSINMSTSVRIQAVSNLAERQQLGPALAKLSAPTEMSSYNAEKWNFLLQAGDITAYVATNQGEGTDIVSSNLLGSLLKIKYGEGATAFGMMLVSKEARGQGVAKKLLNAAMAGGGDLLILGTCTELGRPVYEKLGYERISTVTRMTANFKDIEWVSGSSNGQQSSFVRDDSQNGSASKYWHQFLELDKKVTGLDRSQTLNSLCKYPYVSTAYLVGAKDQLILGAMITCHTGSPVASIGPILGQPESLPIILQHIQKELESKNSAITDMAMIVSDHPKIVDMLAQAGFAKAFELGAMTMKGHSFPGTREEYLALIHPTLG